MAISNNYDAQPSTSNSNINTLASSSSSSSLSSSLAAPPPPAPPPPTTTSSAATVDLDLLFESVVDVLRTDIKNNGPTTPASQNIISSSAINRNSITQITKISNNNTATNENNHSSRTQLAANRPYYRRKNCRSDTHDQSIDRYIKTIIEERVAYFQKIIPKLDSERTKECMREYIVNRIKDLIKNVIPKESYFIINQDQLFRL